MADTSSNEVVSSTLSTVPFVLTGGGDSKHESGVHTSNVDSSFVDQGSPVKLMSCEIKPTEVVSSGSNKLPVEQTESDSSDSGGTDNDRGSPKEELGVDGVVTEDNHLKTLISAGINQHVAERLCHLFASEKLSLKDLDDRAFEALKEFGNVEGALAVLNEFDESSLEHVSNKSAFLCGIMKAHRQKEKAGKAAACSQGNSSLTGANHATTSTSSSPSKKEQNHSSHNQAHPGPDDAKLKAILDRTGYTLDITSGQRKYGGPPPDWEGNPPCPGSEIFVGKIPKEIFEDELIVLFEQCGKIWDLRLMVDPLTGFNRGYCFITYCNKEEALAAQQKFDSYEIRKGKTLKVNISVPNLRLFVGNIPKSKSKEEIFQEFSKLTCGLLEVIVYSSPDDRKRNRGFCFLEYDSHKAASLAKRKLSSGRTKVWGCDILVDWADPQEEPDQETMSKVKVLYVRNLVATVTEDQLREMFEQFGTVERVKKIKDYAFVHFDDRDNAVRAMNELNGKETQGVRIEVSLAKPPSDRKKKEEILRNRERRVMLMMQQRALMIGVTGVPRGAAMVGGPVAPLPPPPPPPPGPPMVNPRSGRNRSAVVPGAMLSPPAYGHRPMPRNCEYDFGYYGQYGFDEYPDYTSPHLSHQYEYGYNMYTSPPNFPTPHGPVGAGLSSAKASSRAPQSRSKKVQGHGIGTRGTLTSIRGASGTRGRFQVPAQPHSMHHSQTSGGHYGNPTGLHQAAVGQQMPPGVTRNGRSSKRRVNSQKGVIPKRKANPRGGSGGEHDSNNKQGVNAVSGAPAEWYKDEEFGNNFGQPWK